MHKIACALACWIYACHALPAISGHENRQALATSASDTATWDAHTALGSLTSLAKILVSFNACQGQYVGCQPSIFYSDHRQVAPHVEQHNTRSRYPLMFMGKAGAASKKYGVRFRTTAGDFTVNLDSGLSPAGVARFLDLAKSDFFKEQLFYRVIPGFLIQFGVAADPALQKLWETKPSLPDEPNRDQFRAGSISFAGNGPGSRSCHLFVALEPHGAKLGTSPWETTLGHLDDAGLKAMAKICENHQAAFKGDDTGKLQGKLVEMGNKAAKNFPELDRILSVEVLS
mmetsp:Transcript_159990/g.298535  ORF Transcript_159990/g.298535 Transcript_159990/m.298535 type:complete len:286 (-) Transcript_159990:17-874(-)